MIKCIYCLKEKPSSKEHVLPYTLGGNLTIQCVCQDCNNGFSTIDQSLADSSLITLSRLAQQPDAVLGQSMKLGSEDDAGKDLEVRLGHRFQPTTKAQLIFKKKESGNYEIRGRANDISLYKNLFAILKKMISKGKIRDIPILANISNELSEKLPKLVLNRSNSIAFRPSEESKAQSEYDEVISFVEKKIDDIEEKLMAASENAPRIRVDTPNIVLNLSVDFGKNLRAVSKIAFNFIAAIRGPEVLFDSSFDSLREYILNGKNADAEGSLWDIGIGENRDMSGTRYAKWLNGYCQQSYSLSSQNSHTITMNHQEDRFLAFIEFYGQQAYCVDLGDIPSLHQELLPLVHEFDFINRTNKKMNPFEIANRISEKMGVPRGT